jgi:alpha-1,3-rhamnosyl/mannosyltransferase
MRIGIDARHIQDHFPGIGRYTFNLVKALTTVDRENHYLIYYDPRSSSSYHDLSCLATDNFELREMSIPVFSIREQMILPRALRNDNLGVFHSPYYIKPYLLPCPSIVTVHDTIPLHSPQYVTSRRSRLLFRLTMKLAVRRSSLVLVDSEASKHDVVKYFGLQPKKVRVAPLAADEFQAPPQAESSEIIERLQPYILYVGINKPHKNLPRLIRAYHRSGVPQRLVLAGPEDERFPEARQTVSRLGLEDMVQFLGRVSEADLANLYRGAHVFAFPSLAEGFGLPLLEALSCGVPTVASNIPPLAELAGDATLLVDPHDTRALADALKRASEDEDMRHDLSEKGRQRSRLYSWRSTAERTLAAYREVVGA